VELFSVSHSSPEAVVLMADTALAKTSGSNHSRKFPCRLLPGSSGIPCPWSLIVQPRVQAAQEMAVRLRCTHSCITLSRFECDCWTKPLSRQTFRVKFHFLINTL
jgi:hypothetical protein